MADNVPATAPLRVAVVGAGPAGYFTAAAALKSFPAARVNMFERLPTPWGLLRAGIAPDHENMRVLGPVFDKIAEQDGFSLYAGVEVGSDITQQELLDHHHAVVYATGAQRGRRLGLDGEDLDGAWTAGDVVAWYNGHPDHVEPTPDLSHSRAIVVGNGNVALDIARMLTKDASSLRSTDIADHALDALDRSKVQEVIVLGRRGPREASFSLSELSELSKLPDITLTADLGGEELDVPEDPVSTNERRLALLAELGRRTATDPGTRHVHLRFHTQPRSLRGDGHLEKVALSQSLIGDDGSVGISDTVEWVEAGLFVTAVGFESAPVRGLRLDERTGVVAHVDGRVVDEHGNVAASTYVVGWAKRGPSGVLGTNKKCAADTVQSIHEDLDRLLERDVRDDASLDTLLDGRCSPIGVGGWQRINASEMTRGKELGRPRVKLVDRTSLMAAAGAATKRGAS